MKDAIVYFEQLLLGNDLVTQDASAIISDEAIQIGEEIYELTISLLGTKTFIESEKLILIDEPDECVFHEMQDKECEDYEVPEKVSKQMEYIPLEYKVCVVNIAK